MGSLQMNLKIGTLILIRLKIQQVKLLLIHNMYLLMSRMEE